MNARQRRKKLRRITDQSFRIADALELAAQLVETEPPEKAAAYLREVATEIRTFKGASK